MNERSWSAEVRDIGDRIAGLSIARAAELHRYLERVHGVRVAASVIEDRDRRIVEPEPILPPAPTAFRLVLEGFEPARKINVIKVVRELTGLGLKEAKDLVEMAPRVVRDGLQADQARVLKAQLDAAGARTRVVGVSD
jgi:large subunit ribosomal protein L7/L12